MATANPIMELRYYTCTLLSTHRYQDWVSETVPEQLPIQKGVLGRISFYLLALLGLQWEYSISQVASVGRHPVSPYSTTHTCIGSPSLTKTG